MYIIGRTERRLLSVGSAPCDGIQNSLYYRLRPVYLNSFIILKGFLHISMKWAGLGWARESPRTDSKRVSTKHILNLPGRGTFLIECDLTDQINPCRTEDAS